ncbi:ABC transporter permease [Clostridium lacusfryxellense]|uniref:ABC transporter permease n=1 Tax=Clostridium lacusfryxellense TaxID=205328 RepID=UPI001C0BB688|nr:ABC transporter permease [Clostridium lacusfryxellense]MBU3113231.1 ABC transporter permease [Clostridium lacusfryxellense]
MWLAIIAILILLFIILPILVLIPLSFTSLNYFKFPPTGFSLKWYQDFLQNEEWVECFFRSLEVACLTAILAIIIGTLASLAVTRINFKHKKAFMALMVAPMVIPVVIIGVALYNFYAPLKLNNTIMGLVLSHTLIAIPIVFITLTAGLKGVDSNIELAAAGLGSKPIGVFFKIILPQIKPSMLSACLFAFITSLDEITVTIFLSGTKTKTLPIAMWESMRNNITPTIASVSTILIFGTIISFMLPELFRLLFRKRNLG